MHLDFWDGLIDFGPFLSLFIIFHFRNLVITMVLLLLSVAYNGNIVMRHIAEINLLIIG